MTLLEMKKKVLQLIEEIDTEEESLTGDPDIAAKMNAVLNQVQYELARIRKIPAYVSKELKAGEVFDMDSLERFYQLRLLRFVNEDGQEAGYELVDRVILPAEAGTATFFYYRFPQDITDDTPDTYEFELAADALEVMPYGVAADLLKSDVSTEYGEIYSRRYETMLQRLDTRFATGSMYMEGGIEI